jgi:hypothetical protein
MNSSDNTRTLRGQMTFELLKQLQERNELRRQDALSYLGERWVLHPANSTKKKAASANPKPRTSR